MNSQERTWQTGVEKPTKLASSCPTLYCSHGWSRRGQDEQQEPWAVGAWQKAKHLLFFCLGQRKAEPQHKDCITHQSVGTMRLLVDWDIRAFTYL